MKKKSLKIICFVLSLAVISSSPMIPASGVIVAEAHSGRSGSHGGHHSSHRTNGSQNSGKTQAKPTTGWKQDDCGWRYQDGETTCKRDGLYEIDGSCYLFDADGYRMTGWQAVDGSQRYFNENGCMLSDTCSYIDGSYCHFDEHGAWDGTYYEGCEEHKLTCTHSHHTN